MSESKKLQDLRTMLSDGTFHHATYRNEGTLWEGLWIYKHYNGLRGFEPAVAFFKADPELPIAEELVKGTGISVGSYGNG